MAERAIQYMDAKSKLGEASSVTGSDGEVRHSRGSADGAGRPDRARGKLGLKRGTGDLDMWLSAKEVCLWRSGARETGAGFCNEIEANRMRGYSMGERRGPSCSARVARAEGQRGHARAALGGRASDFLRPSCARLLLLSSPHSVQQLLTFTHSECLSFPPRPLQRCIHGNPASPSAPHGSPAPLAPRPLSAARADLAPPLAPRPLALQLAHLHRWERKRVTLTSSSSVSTSPRCVELGGEHAR